MPIPVPESRDAYSHFLIIPTRWHDNDVYGHVNNTVYYGYFDTAINHFLIHAGGLDIHTGPVIGLCVESHCNYFAPVAFPQTLEVGLRVGHLGRSSVRYEIGIFTPELPTTHAQGHFIHVFVDRDTLKARELPEALRRALAGLLYPKLAPH